jgi:peptide/nickel transport system substrate-binding protein
VAGGAVELGGPALLASSASADVRNVARKAAAPKLGGNLIVGVSGGGTQDTVDAQKGVSNVDEARLRNLYDWLAQRDHNFNLIPMLGTDFIPNKSGDQMVVKLRPGVTFHNGKPFTADDVVYTYLRILDPKEGANEGALFSPYIASVEKVDTLTVRFTFKRPFNAFMDFASLAGSAIVPVGYNPKAPIGTGPFKFESFTPGQQSVFTRNEHYWGVGPYVDTLTITDLSDDTARLNALISGAVQAIDTVPYALLPTVQKSSTVKPLISEAGNWNPITMRVNEAPFNDNRVRQAFRLIVDRPQMVTQAYGGQARLGNDLYAIDDPLYDHSLPQRVQDIEKAKSLLKAAGRENLTVQLVTAPIAAGVVDSCVVFAQQAKAAGVTVKISELTPTNLYNNQYLKRLFSVDSWPTLSFFVDTAYSCAPGASFNDTQYVNPKFSQWYYELLATNDKSLQKEIAAEMQTQLYDQGGEIIPGLLNQVDAFSDTVTGFVPDKTGWPLTHFDFRLVSFA